MIRFASVTPNLVVKDVARSTAFYRDVLGFKITMNVPDAEPFVFVGLERDGVPVFLNDKAAALEDHPEMAATPFGGTCTMFFVVTGIDELHAAVAPKANVVMAQEPVLRHARICGDRSRRPRDHVRRAHRRK